MKNTPHFSKISKFFSYFRRLIPSKIPSAIYTPKEFHNIIDYECEISKRYNKKFSLAIFEVNTADENSAFVRRLVRTIHNRFRNIDEIGWYSRRQIGIILPYTSAEGAWKLAEYINNVISSVIAPPAFTIYTYPSERWPRNILQKIWRFINIPRWLRYILELHVSYPFEFQEIINRERERADRSGHIFSLVIFNLELLKAESISVRRFLRCIHRRLRDTDEIGWYGTNNIGIIIPYTSSEEAMNITKSICKSASITSPNFYSIYTYPDSWFKGE